MSNDSISRTEYRNEIEALADYVEEREGERSELVRTEVDNHQWIIYNSYHLDVLQNTDDGPHGWDMYVPSPDSWREVIEAMAFKAIMNDLHAELADSDDE